MKIKPLSAIGALVASLTLYCAHAQVSAFEATVPFPFVVGNRALPSGTYTVQRLMGKPRSASSLGIIVLKAADHRVYKVIVTDTRDQHHVASTKDSRLIFTSYQGKEYLNQVWVAGDEIAHQLENVPSEMTAVGSTGEVIVIGLRHSKSK